MPENRTGGWPSKPLRDLAQIVSGGTPSRYVGEFWEDGTIPWVTPTDLTNTPGRFLSDTREKITHRGLASCSAMLLPVGTLLMTSRATLGEIRIAEREVCTNQGFKSLVPLHGTHGPFLYYQMLQNKERYRALGIGSTFLEVNKRDTERLEVLVPPDSSNQHHIAKILTTVDEAIEQTEALIAKTQQIKAGLMHDLFTRGVTADGQLRPPREEAPQLYKKSPLGWIPKEWVSKDFGSLLNGTPQNGLYKPMSEYGDTGVSIVRIDSFYDGVLLAMDTLRRLRIGPSELQTYGLATGDILVNRVNSIDYVGKSAIVPALQEAVVFESNIMRIRVKSDTITPEFTIRWLCCGKAMTHFRSRAKSAVAQASINQHDVRCLLVPLPRIEEQQKINAIASAIEETLDQNQEELNMLNRIKHGLMQDLLTGRVEVKTAPDPMETPAHV